MGISKWGVQNRQLTPKERWLSFGTILLVATLAALNMFKASPAIQYIASDMEMPQSMVSQIMGSYSIPALVFAYIGMWLGQKMGFKLSSLISVIIMMLGTIISLFVTDSTAFLAGRVLEGCGYGIIAVLGANAVPMLFNLGGGIEVPFAWHTIWIAAIILEIVVGILVILFVKMPAVDENTIVEGDISKKLIEGKDFMVSAIVVSVAFIFFAYINVVAINTMYPSFLQTEKGMAVTASSWFTMIASILGAAVGIFCGVVAARRHWRKSFILIGYILGAIVAFFCLWSPGDDMVGPWIGIIVWVIPLGFIPTCTRAIIPRLVVEPKKLDFAMSTMGFLMALGKVLGGYFVSPSIVAFGYTGMARYTLAPMMVIGVILIAVFVKGDKQFDKLREEERQASLNLSAESSDKAK